MIAAAAPVPVLDLQFQNGVLDPRITFARASSGNYFSAAGILLTATTNAPRFASPGPAGGQIGLLMEGAATNLALWCRDLTQAVWVKLLGTAALDQVGVDGISNAASSFTATSNGATALQTVTLSSAARTFSLFLKRITGTGVVSITQDGVTFTTVVLTSAYQEFPLTATQLNPIIGVKLATSGDKIAFDYSQLETGTFATSPIFTTTATVTRAAETASMASAGIIKGQLPFTAEVSFTPEASSGNTMAIALIDDGTTTNRIPLVINSNHLMVVQLFATGVSWNYTDSVALAALENGILNTTISPGQMVSSFGGRLPSPITSTGTPVVPPGLTTIRFGSNASAANPAFGFLLRFTIRPYAVPVAALASSSLSGLP